MAQAVSRYWDYYYIALRQKQPQTQRKITTLVVLGSTESRLGLHWRAPGTLVDATV
jgi:hypothetical protein